MAKKEELTAEAPALIDDGTGKQLSVSDLLAQMEKAEVGMELISEYLKFEVGESQRLIFVEMSQIKKINGEEGETTPAAKFLAKDGRLKISADAVLVSLCTGFANRGQRLVPLEVSCIGLKGPKGREYKEFSVKNLLM